MRILVTGGAGFIGSHVVDAYLAAGHEVAVFDDLSTGSRANVAPEAVLYEGDLLTSALDEAFERFQPEVVNHHAAQSSVKVSMTDPVRDLAVNAGGSARVAALAVRHGARVIYASTGGALYGEPEYLPVDEMHPVRPLSNYGLSKHAGERYLDLHARTEGLSLTVLRYANVYGPRQDPRGEAGVIAIFTGLMLGGDGCTIDGDGEQLKDYVFVGDVARANLLALDVPAGEAYNIGTGVGTSVLAIHRALAEATGNRAPVRHGPPRPGDVRRVWLGSARAEDRLGWHAEVGIGEGIARTVAWYREGG